MGTPVGRVEREFILTNVTEKKMPIRINGFKKTRDAVILRIEDDSIVLYNDDGGFSDFTAEEEVRIFFSYFGHVMTFPTSVVKADDYLQIQIPDEMVKNLQRKYERIALPRGILVSFTMENRTFELTFPRTEEYNPAEQPVYQESFPEDTLEKLMDGVSRRLSEFKANYTVQMFRDRGPESWEEEIITRTGKSIFVSPMQVGFPAQDPDNSGRILTRTQVLSRDYTLNMSEILGSEEELTNRFRSRQEEGLKAQIYCPLVYQDYVIGYLHVWSEHVSLGIEVFEYIYQFSKVLVYSLKNHGYFKHSLKQNETFEAEILDISASGLLFTHPDEGLRDQLVLYSDIDLNLRMGPRKMVVSSRIMRKFQDRDRTFFGCQYINIKPEDFRFLFDAIYGRELTPEDETLWEGGAEPPRLSFD